VAGGRVSLPPGSSAFDPSRLIGYNTTRGDNGTRPVLKAGAGQTAMAIVTMANNCVVENVETDGSANTGNNGILGSTSIQCLVLRCRARACDNAGFNVGGTNCKIAHCEAIACARGFAISNGTICYACEAHASYTTGFDVQIAIVSCCLAYGGTGTAHGFSDSTSGAPQTYLSCTSYGNGGQGFYLNASPASILMVNCLAVNNTGFGFTSDTANTSVYLETCAGYNNTGGNTSNIGKNEGFIALTGNPFTNAGAGDFSLNNTAGGGALLRGLGWPAAFPAGTTSTYMDVGAAQVQGVSGGGGMAKGIPTIASIRN
jgi:hypothetical protein